MKINELNQKTITIDHTHINLFTNYYFDIYGAQYFFTFSNCHPEVFRKIIIVKMFSTHAFSKACLANFYNLLLTVLLKMDFYQMLTKQNNFATLTRHFIRLLSLILLSQVKDMFTALSNTYQGAFLRQQLTTFSNFQKKAPSQIFDKVSCQFIPCMNL